MLKNIQKRLKKSLSKVAADGSVVEDESKPDEAEESVSAVPAVRSSSVVPSAAVESTSGERTREGADAAVRTSTISGDAFEVFDRVRAIGSQPPPEDAAVRSPSLHASAQQEEASTTSTGGWNKEFLVKDHANVGIPDTVAARSGSVLIAIQQSIDPELLTSDDQGQLPDLAYRAESIMGKGMESAEPRSGALEYRSNEAGSLSQRPSGGLGSESAVLDDRVVKVSSTFLSARESITAQNEDAPLHEVAAKTDSIYLGARESMIPEPEENVATRGAADSASRTVSVFLSARESVFRPSEDEDAFTEVVSAAKMDSVYLSTRESMVMETPLNADDPSATDVARKTDSVYQGALQSFAPGEVTVLGNAGDTGDDVADRAQKTGSVFQGSWESMAPGAAALTVQQDMIPADQAQKTPSVYLDSRESFAETSGEKESKALSGRAAAAAALGAGTVVAAGAAVAAGTAQRAPKPPAPSFKNTEGDIPPRATPPGGRVPSRRRMMPAMATKSSQASSTDLSASQRMAEVPSARPGLAPSASGVLDDKAYRAQSFMGASGSYTSNASSLQVNPAAVVKDKSFMAGGLSSEVIGSGVQKKEMPRNMTAESDIFGEGDSKMVQRITTEPLVSEDDKQRALDSSLIAQAFAAAPLFTSERKSTAQITVLIYSMYGHVKIMADAILEGLRSIQGVDVSVYQVAETLEDEVLKKLPPKATSEFPTMTVADVEILTKADGIVLGVPTRFGAMPTQMKAILDACYFLWRENGLLGKLATVFMCSASMQGGQETTMLSTIHELAHYGMLYFPLGIRPEMIHAKEPLGGTCYGAGSFTAANGTRLPSETEKQLARYQGNAFATKVREFACA